MADGTSFTRAATLNPAGINFEDCERDVVLHFPLVASGSASAASGYELYAFAGSGCDQGSTAVAPGVTGGTCWPIAAGPIAYNLDPGGFVVSIRARQVLAQYAAAPKETYAEVASTDDSSCHIQPTDAALQISVYFVFGTDIGLASVGGSGMAQLNADLAAAAPPTALSVAPANTGLLPTWTTHADADTVGYNVYYLPAAGGDAAATSGGASSAALGPTGAPCPDPFPPASTAAADAGTGTGTGTVAGLSLQPAEAVAGQYPFVAVTSGTDTSATLAGLTNNEDYVVAVAATDAFGNVGALSTFAGGDMICQTPSASAEALGGDDDGGGCSVGRGAGGARGAGVAAFFAGAALVFARRRRRENGARPGRARAQRGR